MPTGRGTLAACAVDGIIYAIGGFLETGQVVATVEAYDPKSNQWTTKRAMPQPRWFLTASVANGIIYVFHGTDVFAYDPKANSWTTKTNHLPLYSWGLMSAEANGTIYVFGGTTEDWNDGIDLTLAYDPAGDKFTACRRMPRKRITSACGVIGGKVYLSGGVSKEPAQNPDAVFYTTMDIFDLHGGVMPQIMSVSGTSPDSLRLSWQAEAGIRYGIETNTSLTGGGWGATGTTVLATNTMAEATCSKGNSTSLFLRVFETK